LDGWRECFQPRLWWDVVHDLGVDMDFYVHRYRPTTEVLPWDHVNVKKGREYLEKEQKRSLIQLEVMAPAEGHRRSCRRRGGGLRLRAASLPLDGGGVLPGL